MQFISLKKIDDIYIHTLVCVYTKFNLNGAIGKASLSNLIIENLTLFGIQVVKRAKRLKKMNALQQCNTFLKG